MRDRCELQNVVRERCSRTWQCRCAGGRNQAERREQQRRRVEHSVPVAEAALRDSGEWTLISNSAPYSIMRYHTVTCGDFPENQTWVATEMAGVSNSTTERRIYLPDMYLRQTCAYGRTTFLLMTGGLERQRHMPRGLRSAMHARCRLNEGKKLLGVTHDL